MIPLAECRERTIYELQSRNLRYGVFNGATGFVGIRTKWQSRYLFTEFHWDTGPPYGTVLPIRAVGVVPDDIPLFEDNQRLFDLLDLFEAPADHYVLGVDDAYITQGHYLTVEEALRAAEQLKQGEAEWQVDLEARDIEGNTMWVKTIWTKEAI